MNAIHRCCHGDDADGCFVILRNPDGNWCVSTPDKRTGGLFSSEEDAYRFARAEARSCGHAEVIVIGAAGLDIEVFDESRLGKSLHVDFDASTLASQETVR